MVLKTGVTYSALSVSLAMTDCSFYCQPLGSGHIKNWLFLAARLLSFQPRSNSYSLYNRNITSTLYSHKYHTSELCGFLCIPLSATDVTQFGFIDSNTFNRGLSSFFVFFFLTLHHHQCFHIFL